MIPKPIALRSLAVTCLALADEYGGSGHRGPPANPAKTAGRSDGRRRLHLCHQRLWAAAKDAAGEVDPAVVGYLLVWIRGDHASLASLLQYLYRRQSPAWEPLKNADHSDKAATVLAALEVQA